MIDRIKIETYARASLEKNMRSFIALCLTSIAFATEPTTTTHAVVNKDWLSKLAITQYGESGLMYTPYLCQYNLARGQIRSGNCDMIVPGDKIYLPPLDTLYCMALEDLGHPCTGPRIPLSEREYDLYLLGTLPPQAQGCTLILQAFNPTRAGSIAFNVARAKQIAIYMEDKAGITSRDPNQEIPGYIEMCTRASNDPALQTALIQPTPEDYWTIDQNGEPIFINYWGPEDAVLETGDFTTPPMIDPSIIASCTHEVRSDAKRQVIDQCPKAPSMNTKYDCAYARVDHTIRWKPVTNDDGRIDPMVFGQDYTQVGYVYYDCHILP